MLPIFCFGYAILGFFSLALADSPAPTPEREPAPRKQPAPPTAAEEKKAEDSSLLLTTRYMTTLHQAIQKKWDTKKIPLMEMHNRSITVTLWIDAQGRLKKLKIVKTSGHKDLDHTLLKAIYKASPFPQPPSAILADIQQEGIDIVFRRRVFDRNLRPLQLDYKGQATVPTWTPRETPKNK